MHHRIPALFISLTLALTAACGSQQANNASAQLTDIWSLQAVNGNPITVPEDPIYRQPVLQLDVANQSFNGNDSCNQLFGRIEQLTSNEIALGPIAGTKMMCPDMSLADSFSKALQSTDSYRREGLLLYFYNSQGDEILRFRKAD